jgi:hypothetical protein
MQSGATTVGQTEVASGPCHIRSAVLPASGSSVLIQVIRHRGKRIVRVTADQTDGADDQHENRGKHHGVFGNVLTFIARPKDS